MISPFEGRVTANHHTRGGYKGHRGLDIAPPKPGQTQRPVYAAFAGTVKKLWRTAKPGSKTSTWAPGRTGDGILIANPDGEGNGYNHVYPINGLKVGDKVQAGDLIGHNNTSGNQSGPHVHFEMWKDWEDPCSDYDPRDAFDAHKVRPGSAPVIGQIGDVKPQANVKPRPTTPVAKPAASKPKPKVYTTVRRGSRNTTVGKVQAALYKQGYTKQTRDNVFGAQTEANVRDFQRRTKLFQDGIAGPVTQKKLGL